jgi:hypothetical protein
MQIPIHHKSPDAAIHASPHLVVHCEIVGIHPLCAV